MHTRKSNPSRVLAMLLTLVMVIGMFTGCAGKRADEPETTATVPETTEPVTEATEAVTEATTEPTVPETEAPTEPEVTEPAYTRGIVCDTDQLNVRENPGVSNKKIGVLNRNDEVRVYETRTVDDALWGRIDNGWVAMKYIKLDGSAPAAPAASGNTVNNTSSKPETGSSHEHDYQAKIYDATCVNEGYTLYTCSCGASYKDDNKPALGHSWSSWKTVKQPTEYSEGLAERTCSRCGLKDTKTLAKIIPDHTHKYDSKITKAATCTSDGVKTYTCSCGDKYTETIPATGHNWSSWKTVKQPTETSEGRDERTCSNCNAKESRTLPKLPVHNHRYDSKITKAATCTSDGIKTFTCACGDSYTETIKATGHSWSNWVTTKQPTETSEGKAERACSKCNLKESKTLDKLPSKPTEHTHKYTSKITKAATCTSDGVKTYTCTCGDSYTETIKATGHSWSGWNTVKEPTESAEGKAEHTCSKCSAKESKSLPKLPPKPTEPSKPEHVHTYQNFHVIKDATCTEEGIMEIICTQPGCYHTSTKPIPLGMHTWVYHHDDGEYYYVSVFECKCGWQFKRVEDWEAHGDSYGPGHFYEHDSFSNINSEKVVIRPSRDWRTCSVCGATEELS